MTTRYLIRVKQMRALKKMVADLMHHRGRANRLSDELLELKAGQQDTARRWKRAAVVAIAMCPGSFVLGGFVLQRLLEWWF